MRAGFEVFYWRERDEEIDFIVKRRGVVTAIEATASPNKRAAMPLQRLARKLGLSRTLVVGPGGADLGEFLKSDLVRI